MNAAQAIASLPPDTRVSIIVGQGDMTADELREAFANQGPLYLTTAQASERYGWGRKYWARIGPEMAGAFNDGHWHLPVEGCEAHVAAKSTRARRRRAPWPPKAAHYLGSGA
jgi:hypothetical protein